MDKTSVGENKGYVSSDLGAGAIATESPPGGPPTADPNEHFFTTHHLLKDLKGRTISSGFVTGAAQGAQFILSMGSIMVLARLLTPQDFGLVAMVMAVVGFFRVFKDAGLSLATVQREGITHAQVSNLFWINLALSGCISVIFAAAAPGIAWFYREPRLVSISLALAGTFLLSGATVQHMALLNRQMRFKVIAVIQICSLIAGIVVGIGMARFNYGYWSLVASQVVTSISTLLLTLWKSRWRPQVFTARSGTRPLLGFGANLTASGFLWSLARGSDGLFLGRFYGAESVGLYTRASALLMRPLDLALSPIEAVLVPTLSRLQDQRERYRRAFLQIYEAIALAGFVFGGLFLGLSRPLTLVVLGAKWEKAAVIFAAFTLCALCYPLITASTWLFSSQGRGKDLLRVTIIGSITTFCSFLAGLPFGPVGVASAYSASCLLVLIPLLYHFAGRQGPIGTKDLWAAFLKHLPVWGVTCGATLLIHERVVGLAPLIQVFICTAAALSAGAGFISIYAPSRRTSLALMRALREWSISRRAAKRGNGSARARNA